MPKKRHHELSASKSSQERLRNFNHDRDWSWPVPHAFGGAEPVTASRSRISGPKMRYLLENFFDHLIQVATLTYYVLKVIKHFD